MKGAASMNADARFKAESGTRLRFPVPVRQDEAHASLASLRYREWSSFRDESILSSVPSPRSDSVPENPNPWLRSRSLAPARTARPPRPARAQVRHHVREPTRETGRRAMQRGAGKDSGRTAASRAGELRAFTIGR